ncbi:hypothetical protein QMN07_18465, partial [Leptospira santarosai]|nr:hypothetical protein [Leptospira santarosai]
MDALLETISKLSLSDRERFEKIKSLSLKYPDLFKNIKPTLTKLVSYEDTVSDVFRIAFQYPEDLEEYTNQSIF